MKKFIVLLCAVMLAVLPTAVGTAEDVFSAEEPDGIALIYVPATRDAAELAAARYAGQAVMSAWSGRTKKAAARIDSRNNIYEADSADLYTQRVFDSGNVKGSQPIANDKLVRLLCAGSYDIWFIVPQEAADEFNENKELILQLEEILSASAASRIHIVFIGDDVREPADGSAISVFAEGKTENGAARVSWTRIRSDIFGEKTRTAGDTVHTGSFFIASLYGEPADIPVSRADGTCSFELVSGSSALVLFRAPDGDYRPEIIQETGGQSISPSAELQTGTFQKKEDIWTGLFMEGILKGSYIINISDEYADSLKVFCYPDLNGISPELELGEAVWKRGDHQVVMTLNDDLGRPEDFNVWIEIAENGDTGRPEELTYRESVNAWVLDYSTSANTESVSFTPNIDLNTGDGDLIKTWTGETQSREVRTQEVKVRENAPSGEVIYTDTGAGAGGSVSYSWDQFFVYNPEDGHRLSVTPDSIDEIEISRDDNGFSFTAVADSDRISEKEFDLTISCGETAHPFHLSLRDVSELFEAVEIGTDAGGEPVSAGGSVNVTAEIAADSVQDWRKAAEQIGDMMIKPEQVQLTAGLNIQGEKSATALLTEKDGAWQAGITLNVPETAGSGSEVINAFLSAAGDDGQDRQLKDAGSISVRVENEAPKLKAEGISGETRIVLEGMPGKYEEQDLLQAALGTDKPDLFSDRETGVRTVTVEIDNIGGLELPENGAYSEEEGKWTLEVTNARQPVKIKANAPGEHTLKIWASDGVNESEPLEIRVVVRSRILGYISYAALGLAVLLLIIVLILVIRQIRKPTFDNIMIRCLVTSDDDQDRARELMNKCDPVSMSHLGKKGVSLETILLLTRQPCLEEEYTAAARDITVLPTKHDELNIVFGKKAMAAVGRHDRREILPQGNYLRIRAGNAYIQIENVQ